VKAVRSQYNLTQTELGDLVGVSRQTINSIESGRYGPSTMLALKIAKILKCRFEYLFELEKTDWD
jgi:putative transcriptional regulator